MLFTFAPLRYCYTTHKYHLKDKVRGYKKKDTQICEGKKRRKMTLGLGEINSTLALID